MVGLSRLVDRTEQANGQVLSETGRAGEVRGAYMHVHRTCGLHCPHPCVGVYECPSVLRAEKLEPLHGVGKNGLLPVYHFAVMAVEYNSSAESTSQTENGRK